MEDEHGKDVATSKVHMQVYKHCCVSERGVVVLHTHSCVMHKRCPLCFIRQVAAKYAITQTTTSRILLATVVMGKYMQATILVINVIFLHT